MVFHYCEERLTNNKLGPSEICTFLTGMFGVYQHRDLMETSAATGQVFGYGHAELAKRRSPGPTVGVSARQHKQGTRPKRRFPAQRKPDKKPVPLCITGYYWHSPPVTT